MHLNINSGVAARDSAHGKVTTPSVENAGCTLTLVTKFGERMSAVQVAGVLGYSPTYFTKKIGSEKHRHLDWVKTLLPARVKNGAAFEYKTDAVERLMRGRGLL